MNTKNNKILAGIIFIVLIVVTIQAIYNIRNTYDLNTNIDTNEKNINKISQTKVPENKISGKITGYGDIAIAEMCVNIPPIITYDCNMTNATLNTHKNYNCTFEAIDPNTDSFVYSIQWLTAYELFNISETGIINFKPKLYPQNTHVFRIYLNDNSGCLNNYRYTEFNITVDGENKPPYLIKDIPDQELLQNQYFRFYLNDYFADPDEDNLTYFNILTTGNSVSIDVASNTVDIKGENCGISTTYFVATDPMGLTAQSNTVTYNVTCPSDGGTTLETPTGSSDTESSNTAITPDCKSDWRCNAWAPCLRENFTYKRCLDYNGCGKEYERYLYQNCSYNKFTTCVEKWECNAWSVCKNGTHTRACLDIKNCNINTTKPIEYEKCTMITTCYNGILDGDETAIDCGGACGVCRFIETPTKIKKLSKMALISTGLTIGLTLIILGIFRKNLSKLLLTLLKKKKYQRKIYLTNKQKEKLILAINIIQARLDEHKVNHAIDEINIFIKEYFKQLLAIEVFEKEELITNIVKLQDKDLEKILIIFYAKVINTTHLRNKGTTITETRLQALIDEITHNVYLIGEFTEQDAITSVKDRKTISEDSIEIIYTKMSNLYIALKFRELPLAKKTYVEILTYYAKLEEKYKVPIYNDIIRSYEAIMYLEKEEAKKY